MECLMTILSKIDMSIFEAILSRRSVRQYRSRQVSQETIRILLEAAVRAPSAMHQEPWGFLVVQDRKVLQKLSDISKPLFIKEATHKCIAQASKLLNQYKQSDFNIFYNAGTLILICGKSAAPFYDADCWLAAENMMLAATAMGLGTCVIGTAIPALSLLEVKSELNIPENFTVVTAITLGYPDDQIKPVTRKKPIIFSTNAAAQ
jgi:nitroreductase